MLNAHERHQLRLIEQQLETEDPVLARRFSEWPQAKRGMRNAPLLLSLLAAALAVLAVVTTIFPLLFLASLIGVVATGLYCVRDT